MSNESYVAETSGRLECSPGRAWEKVCFYEHIATEPSWLLRTVLPVPQRTTGAYRKVDDVSRCMYSDGGYLTKQIRRIDDGARIDFDIIEQSIRYAGKIDLKGGTIRIEADDDGACAVHMSTRYEVRGAAVLIPRIFIEFVIKAMHKIVVRDMRERLVRAAVPELRVARAQRVR